MQPVVRLVICPLLICLCSIVGTAEAQGKAGGKANDAGRGGRETGPARQPGGRAAPEHEHDRGPARTERGRRPDPHHEHRTREREPRHEHGTSRQHRAHQHRGHEHHSHEHRTPHDRRTHGDHEHADHATHDHATAHDRRRRGPQQRHSPSQPAGQRAPLAGRDHAREVQRANEERKLQHRLNVADRLRANADRNGNPQLRANADRMEQQAWQHYEQRLHKIDGGEALAGPEPLPPADDPLRSHPDNRWRWRDRWQREPLEPVSIEDAPTASDGSPVRSRTETRRWQRPATTDMATTAETPTTELDRQLAREQRLLERRLDEAARLRQAAEQDGDPGLLDTARRIEDNALRSYERRVEQLVDE